MLETADLAEVLGSIERAEAKLLSWGIVDAGFTRDELEAIVLNASLDIAGLAGHPRGAIVDELLDRRLIFRIANGSTTLFRSRMAESVRLMVRLRQFFRNEDWQAGRPLVSDYRFAITKRQRPKRDLTVDDVLQRLRTNVDMGTAREHTVASYMTTGNGNALSLAAFQVDATIRILSNLDVGGAWGTVITAGTGGGKTHAFYLPAMTWTVEDVRRDPRHFVRVVALYPRQELLRDQLQTSVETALRLGETPPRPVRNVTLGAWFGATPLDAAAVANLWPRSGNSYRCPYLNCPRFDCGGELLWTGSEARDELTCRICHQHVGPDLFMVTRQTMQQTPPDFLFTTTESLNRQLGSTYARTLFGLSGERRPRLCLLDEIHTYEGIHGAHVANVLRRWKNGVGTPVNFVGLSATLINAEGFFADLVNLPEAAISRVEPAGEQMRPVSDEYTVALRHDPTIGTSLLSMTIQLAMLVARVLDSPTYAPSDGIYGTKLFVFTDRLDSVNRLYWDLLDAEGWEKPNRPKRSYQPRTLAALRASRAEPPDAAAAREASGQTWYIAQELGHNVGGDQQLEIDRTSSQHGGVRANAQVVVATAALEVGFDDDAVGAVVQHKAPHDGARFLQRKGRGGRPSLMRPWTVVALSDYGRDRVAFQSFETLVNPRLEAQRLPVSSPYVLKMQGVFAAFDWLARRIPTVGNVWKELSRPTGDDLRSSERQKAIVSRLQAVLARGNDRRDLDNWIRNGLNISNDQLAALCWSPPRALYRHVLPTLIRRLSSGWAIGEMRGADSVVKDPAPEFVPGRLFGELLVPELFVTIPPYRQGQPPREDSLGIQLGLSELAPGNVTRRYAVDDRSEAHWVPIADPGPHGTVVVDLTAVYTTREEGILRAADGADVHCLRPVAARLAQIPQQVNASDRASLSWSVAFTVTGDGRNLDSPQRSRWSHLFIQWSAFLHSDGSQVITQRYARHAGLDQIRQGQRVHRIAEFVDDTGAPAALSFQQEVDGLRLTLYATDDAVRDMLKQPEVLREYRWAITQQAFDDGTGFPDEVSIYDRNWLRLACISGLCAAQTADETTLEDTFNRLGRDGFFNVVRDTAEVMFPSFHTDPSDPHSPQIAGRTLQSLRNLLVDNEVRRAVMDRIPLLWGAVTAEMIQWSRTRLWSTVAGTVIGAATICAPEIDTDDLAVDIVDIDHATAHVWVTETSPGSTGVINRIVELWQQNSHRFLRVMDMVARPGDLAVADEQLTDILRTNATDAELQFTFANVRQAWDDGHEAVDASTQALRSLIERKHLRMQRAASTTLTTRILSPGSDTHTDDLFRRVLDLWDTTEQHAGIAVDSRVVALLASDDAATTGLLPALTDRSQRYVALSTLLWPRGPELARASVEVPNRFVPAPSADVYGLNRLLGDDAYVRVDVTQGEWRAQADTALSDTGSVILYAPLHDRASMHIALLQMASQPTEMGLLQSFPRIDGIWTGGASISARMYLGEYR